MTRLYHAFVFLIGAIASMAETADTCMTHDESKCWIVQLKKHMHTCTPQQLTPTTTATTLDSNNNDSNNNNSNNNSDQHTHTHTHMHTQYVIHAYT